MSGISQQPYFLRAIYEWCVDSGYMPYLTVRVDSRTKVPQAFVKDGQIVLNIGPNAVRNMHMDNEWVTFSARFGGVAHSLEVPVENVLAIHARETGEGMGFSGLDAVGDAAAQPDITAHAPESVPGEPRKPPRGKPQLRVVK